MTPKTLESNIVPIFVPSERDTFDFIQYIHRIDPAKVDSMSIEGDVSLQQVHVM